MNGKKVFFRYPDGLNENKELIFSESSGIIVDKVLYSSLNDKGDVMSFDNYLIRKEDGMAILLHPSYIIKID